MPNDKRRLPVQNDRGSLGARLWARTAQGTLALPDPERPGSLRCVACAHRCLLAPGDTGICGVRRREGDELRVPWGYVARRYVRPVEINTIYHVRPGAPSLTFGMYGCDLRCPYCQNWEVSQALREGAAEGEAPTDVTPEALVDEAVDAGCEVLCGAYNEPMISAEWAHAIFAEGKRRGLVTAVISDGNTTPEAIRFMRPVTDVFRLDLKGSTQGQYRALGGRLQPVLDSIELSRRLGFWVEIVTLVVPGFNDDVRELRGLARTIAEIDPDIPWHLNAFQPRYRMQDRPSPTMAPLVAAAGVGYAKGLRYVYVGNVVGSSAGLSHTRCPGCHETLVERREYETHRSGLVDGGCPRCGTRIAGLWGPRGPFGETAPHSPAGDEGCSRRLRMR